MRKPGCKERKELVHAAGFQSQADTAIHAIHSHWGAFAGSVRWPGILREKRLGTGKLVRGSRKPQRHLTQGAARRWEGGTPKTLSEDREEGSSNLS